MKLKALIFLTLLSSTLFAFDKQEEKLPTELDKTPQIETKTGVYTSISIPSLVNFGVYHRGVKTLSYFSLATIPTALSTFADYAPFRVFTNFGYCGYLNQNRSVAVGLDLFAIIPSKYIIPAPAAIFGKEHMFVKVTAAPIVASILYKENLGFNFIALTAFEVGCRF